MDEDQKAAGPAEPEISYAMPDDSPGWRLAERIGWHLLEKQGEDVLVLDMRGLSDVCDFFVVATGTSDIHVKALGRHLQDELLAVREKPRGIEGMADGRWALLDFFDVVVHVFKSEVRQYFQLERLWGDARSQTLDPEWFRDEEVRSRHPGLFPDPAR